VRENGGLHRQQREGKKEINKKEVASVGERKREIFKGMGMM
jgi:hypothetical protein